MTRPFRTFIGVDLGGGKGKTTALTRLRWEPAAVPASGAAALATSPGPGGVLIVEDCGGNRAAGRTEPGGRGGPCPLYDERLIEYLLGHRGEAVVAMDAPLTLTACVRCQLPVCPGLASCEVATVRWFRARNAAADQQGKPKYTPYTQRATEVVLHEDHGIMPRETLGQGMGPLTARMAYLRRALGTHFRLHHNLLEVYPKATLTQLFPDASPPPGLPPSSPPPPSGRSGQRTSVRYRDSNGNEVRLSDSEEGDDESDNPRRPRSQVARLYKRSGHALPIRTRVLEELPGLRFGPGQWREFTAQNDHQFDALICAYTAYLWARDGWQLPVDPVFTEDGWIWFPPSRG